MGEQQVASGGLYVVRERRLVDGFYIATAGRKHGGLNDGVGGTRPETFAWTEFRSANNNAKGCLAATGVSYLLALELIACA